MLTLQDSMIYGCTLDLTYDELKDFCDNRGWNNLMLFQNLYTLNLVGKSGNADPHCSADWIDVEVDNQNDKFNDEGVFNTNEGYCQFPSVHVVETFYEHVNTVEDPQVIIKKMQHYQTKSK